MPDGIDVPYAMLIEKKLPIIIKMANRVVKNITVFTMAFRPSPGSSNSLYM